MWSLKWLLYIYQFPWGVIPPGCVHVVIVAPAHLGHCLHTQLRIQTCGACLTDRCVRTEWKWGGRSVRGGLFPFLGSLFLYLAHWPVAMVLSAQRLWRTIRSHFRLPAFNGRPRSTPSMSFIKQWVHKGLGEREDGGIHGKTHFMASGPWFFYLLCAHTHTHTHTHTASCTATAISQHHSVTLLSASCLLFLCMSAIFKLRLKTLLETIL